MLLQVCLFTCLPVEKGMRVFSPYDIEKTFAAQFQIIRVGMRAARGRNLIYPISWQTKQRASTPVVVEEEEGVNRPNRRRLHSLTRDGGGTDRNRNNYRLLRRSMFRCCLLMDYLLASAFDKCLSLHNAMPLVSLVYTVWK